MELLKSEKGLVRTLWTVTILLLALGFYLHISGYCGYGTYYPQ